ncbi:phosphoglycolate phosphatase [Sphaerotilus sulfidivorans]|uniref:HAD family hydrolase n=1 Tax=Sphaerotilus sulfidivorans TaxID=639200 RepID=A0A5C1PXJ3_9BURK|nr:HAD-IA family hydrolase [Sphaerotilus sulfidivorans]NZD47240.1 HAD-IA family hydrolase [Sphaerotilus sulfidivorans]QEM99940.1 HAD family hydrolase [Sphaerotilus sulfidivorans]
MSHDRPVHAVLFDLDGTLVDSALDLGGAGNDLRERRGLPPLPLEVFRPLTGTGARGMLRVALGTTPEDADFEALKDEYLAIYATRLTRLTRVFDAMAPVLDALDAAALPWGIVTNKHSRFAEPVVAGTGLATRSRVLVCGDTTARAKPFPDPLLEAARRLAVDPAHCLYVGDDLRDIQAGQAAGMGTVAAAWGYLGDGEPIEAWGADHLARTPAGLLEALLPGR